MHSGNTLHDGHTVKVSEVSKSFNVTKVVDCISFDVGKGEILGMVGPNGAGKTTTLRILMDIIKPDSGDVEILGELLHEGTKNRIGYLPEERGLYKKITVFESLSYLAALKGMSLVSAKARASELLERVNMLQHKDKKIQELSRGMGQTIQFVATMLHHPDLVVLDEPFSGLDPLNVALLKELTLELKSQGKSVILSTHMMNQIEEICDRVLMIHKGRVVLYGSLDKIKHGYRNNSIILECDKLPDGIAGVTEAKNKGRYYELFLARHASAQEVLNVLVSRGVRIDRFEISTPSLNEIFIQVVRNSSHE